MMQINLYRISLESDVLDYRCKFIYYESFQTLHLELSYSFIHTKNILNNLYIRFFLYNFVDSIC